MLNPIPIYVFLLQSIPESFLWIKVGLALFNIDIPGKRALPLAIIIAFSSYILRIFVSIFGIHTFLMTILLVILLYKIEHIPLAYAFISMLTGALIIGVLEGAVLGLAHLILEKSIEDLVLNPWLNILFFIPPASILLGIFYILKRKNLYLLDLGGSENYE